MTKHCVFAACAALICALAVGVADSAERGKSSQTDASAADAVDVFAAIEAKQIDVKFIALTPNKANLVIENKTKKLLTIKLPEAFAGTPVLAQVAAAGDANQAVGGGAAGGAFNIAPEKTRKVEVACVCLEHGKPDPYSKVPYQLKPISAVTDKPEVAALVARYSRGDVSTNAAQAAAWHLQNGMSWKELATKQIEHVRGPSEPYFTRQEIAEGMKLATSAVAHAKDHAPATADYESYSPGARK